MTCSSEPTQTLDHNSNLEPVCLCPPPQQFSTTKWLPQLPSKPRTTPHNNHFLLPCHHWWRAHLTELSVSYMCRNVHSTAFISVLYTSRSKDSQTPRRDFPGCFVLTSTLTFWTTTGSSAALHLFCLHLRGSEQTTQQAETSPTGANDSRNLNPSSTPPPHPSEAIRGQILTNYIV